MTEPDIVRAPELDDASATFADALARLGPVLDGLATRPALVQTLSEPPESLRDCVEAAMRFVAAGSRDADAILDARIALSEYGEPHHVDLLVWLLNASGDMLSASRLSQITGGMPLAALANLDRRGEIDWLVAYNRLRKPTGLDPVRMRDAYKTFIKANLAEMRQGATWRTALAAFSISLRARRPH